MQKIFKIKSISTVASFLAFIALVSMALSGCSQKEVHVATKQTLLVQEPVLDPKLMKEDFAFPSRPPRLSRGKIVFTQNCLVCHTGAMSYDKIKDTRPIDTFLMLTRGDHGHPSFKDKLTRDERWEALFYARYLAGESNIHNKEVAAIFGSNCAVCHGTKGFADGPLYTGHASAHELGLAPIKEDIDPPPANFHSYARMYNRTDDQLVKFITEGIYPSAMPSWKGREDTAKNVVFDDPLILDLVKYVRAFAYENDLPDEESKGPVSGPKHSKELSALTSGAGGKRERHSL